MTSGGLILSNTAVLDTTITCMCSKNEKTAANNGCQKCGHISKTVFNTSSMIDEPVDVKLFDISSRILRLFVIDKQIQELMEEKTNIYNELLSQKEIASTLFNSWADNHLKQQRNTLNNDSQQFSKSSEFVKQMCSRTDTPSMTDQSKKPQNELINNLSVHSRTDSSGEVSNVCNNSSDENCKVSCVGLNKLIGSCKENLFPVKKEMTDDVLNLYSNRNSSGDQQNIVNKNDSKLADYQNVSNKAMKNISHSEVKPYATVENDNNKFLQTDRELNKKNFIREFESSSSRSAHSSSDKRKHICGDLCGDGYLCKARSKKRKKVEDAADLIDFINLDTDSSEPEVAETVIIVPAPKISSVSKSNIGTPDSLLKSKSKEAVTKEFENPRRPVLCLKVRYALYYYFIIYIIN